jgi:hypothetical protein
MVYIEISNINGTPPFQIYLCDYGGNNCSLVQTEYDPVYLPVIVYLPSVLIGSSQVMCKIVDGDGCETFQILVCPTPTPTPTMTVTPTSTPTPTPTPSTT